MFCSLMPTPIPKSLTAAPSTALQDTDRLTAAQSSNLPQYQPKLTPAPAQLVDDYGQLPTAIFDQAVHPLNFDQFVLTSPMDLPVSRLRRHFAFKQFQFVGVSGADWWLGIAIADVRFVSSGFAYFVRHGQQPVELELLRPFALGSQLAASASQGTARIGGNSCYWQFECTANYWQIKLYSHALQADFQLVIAGQPPLALSAPTGYQGATYTEKNNALALRGQLQVHGLPVDLSNARGGYDFSAGFMRRRTAWRWASINSLLDGKPFGLNLANGVNETGVCENALWFDGVRQHLSPAQFSLQRGQDTPWQITTLCGELQLNFSPGFCRQQRLHLGVLASNFRQYTGFFNGAILLKDGRRISLSQCPGWVEDHYAKW